MITMGELARVMIPLGFLAFAVNCALLWRSR